MIIEHGAEWLDVTSDELNYLDPYRFNYIYTFCCQFYGNIVKEMTV